VTPGQFKTDIGLSRRALTTAFFAVTLFLWGLPASGFEQQDAYAGRLSHIWSHRLYDQQDLEAGLKEFGHPVFIENGRFLAVGDRTGTLWFFDVAKRRPIWQRKLSGAIVAQPVLVVLADKRQGLLVGDGAGKLRLLDTKDGRDIWKSPLSSQGSFRARPLVHGPIVVAVDSANRVLGTTIDGKFLFDVGVRAPEEFSLFGDCTPATDGHRIIVGFSDGTVASLDPVRGQRMWETVLPSSATKITDAQAGPVILGDRVWIGGPRSGLNVLNAKDGTVEKTLSIEGLITLLPAATTEIYGLTWNGGIVRLAAGPSGAPTVTWSVRVDGIPGEPALTDKSVVFCNGTGLMAVSRQDGSVSDYVSFSRGCASGVATAPGRAAFVTGDGLLRVYQISL
jgi:outer membrane protein assembly factor BamB